MPTQPTPIKPLTDTNNGSHEVPKTKAPTMTPEKSRPEQPFETLDRMTHARLAQATSGISPSVLAEAWMDWAVHLATSPGKQLQMMQQAFQNAQALAAASLGVPPPDAASGTPLPLPHVCARPGMLWSRLPMWARSR